MSGHQEHISLAHNFLIGLWIKSGSVCHTRWFMLRGGSYYIEKLGRMGGREGSLERRELIILQRDGSRPLHPVVDETRGRRVLSLPIIYTFSRH